MATSNGKKRHNWTTNGKIVDRDTDKVAIRFIDACLHLTPAEEVKFDNLMGVSDAVRDHNAGIKIIQTTSQTEIEDDEWSDWKDDGIKEPTAKDLQDIERNG